ncbi:MAG: TldD/PmbA family protein [Alphaproteobacteria bacterium]|nr:TldD/PmbA family protein [Alphaproteobacteria bacterium]
MGPEVLAARFRQALPAGVDHATLRWVDERRTHLEVRDDVLEPPEDVRSVGAMVTVRKGSGQGYAATSDLSPSGLRAAVAEATRWAERTSGRMVFDPREVPTAVPSGAQASRVGTVWDAVPLADRVARLAAACKGLDVDGRIVARSASVIAAQVHQVLLTSDGGEVTRTWHGVTPELEAVAHYEGVTQRRTLGGFRGASQQGGVEVLDRFDYDGQARRVGDQAVELVLADNCPSGAMDVLIAPDQMMLQIHESIGHPLELDRILGDERNYAGTSFVTADMFGTYQYGSSLLNVSFDPTVDDEFASYAFDDDGTPASKVMLIDRGVLLRPLGSVTSGARAGMAALANSRASSWNRPPIDRMANINLEPGTDSVDALIGRVRRGVWMETNLSWSIDDSRNKFQFGCEYAREIVDGRLGRVLRNPNYRGISARFWRSLAGVGDRSSWQVLGTPFCGKGEPNQVIRVGHASPVCLFTDVDVFGAA